MSAGDSERPNYSGMTINERLFSAGLLHEFDAETRLGNRTAMITILRRVDLSEREAAVTVDTILADPSRYGLMSI